MRKMNSKQTQGAVSIEEDSLDILVSVPSSRVKLTQSSHQEEGKYYPFQMCSDETE